MTFEERLKLWLETEAMTRFPKVEALNRVEKQMPKLQEHLIKLAVWGDHSKWRDEVWAFVLNVQKVRTTLKSRQWLKPQEYLDRMDYYDNSSHGVNVFQADADMLDKGKLKGKEKVRTIEEARKVVKQLQETFAEAWSKGLLDKKSHVMQLLDDALEGKKKKW